MIKYGTVELKVKRDTIRILPTKTQEVRHYPGTDKNDVVSKGRGATTITCTLIADTEEERLLYDQILHDNVETTLEIGRRFYKKVTTGDSSPSQPGEIDLDGNWIFDATFIALDPVPYDIVTGGALY